MTRRWLMHRPGLYYRVMCALGLHAWVYTRERDARACMTCPKSQRLTK